jgi:large subunit ribosomal protein L13
LTVNVNLIKIILCKFISIISSPVGYGFKLYSGSGYKEGKKVQTYMATPKDIEKKWYILDAANKPLGRLATEAARLLRGKHKPIFTPHIDTGDHVIIINAEKVLLTGNKLSKKKYYQHSRYPGGLKSMDYQTLLATKPERAIQKAVKGMIPHNRLGRKILTKMRVYRGAEHPHAAQKPEVWNVES